MKVLADLVATALVGTGRAPLPAAAAPTPATQALLGGCVDRSPERRLLIYVATLSTWRRAGLRAPAVSVDRPSVAGKEERTPCPQASAGHLVRMLEDDRLSPLLPEWLQMLGANGFCLPHRWLPEMLDLACQKVDLRPLVIPVLGTRGRWLGLQRPVWSDLLVPEKRDDVVGRWQTGSYDGRLALLKLTRGSDPELARELLHSTWDQEPPREREAFLQVFEAGLSLADEPVLEAALDDRRKEVRAVAAGLLAALPGSRLCARMIDRAGPLLGWEPGEKPSLRNLGRGRKPSVTVTLPESCDKGMQRDGIQPRPLAGMGERAWWLTQMLAAIPPDHWCRQWQVTPSDLLAAAADGEWHTLLWSGWSLAAQRHESAGWAVALVESSLPKLTVAVGRSVLAGQEEISLSRTVIGHVWSALSTGQQEAFMLQTLRDDRRLLGAEHPAVWLLALCRHQWSVELARAILAHVRQSVVAKSKDFWDRGQLYAMLPQMAFRFSPALVDQASSGWPTDSENWEFWSDNVEKFLFVLQFRHDMLAALSGH